MDDLIKLQDHAKTTIENFIRNYKKDGKERKTKVYYETRITNLEKYWEDFKKNDAKIALLVTEEIQKQNPYFINGIYSFVENFYLESYELLLSDFQRVYPPTPVGAVNVKDGNVTVINPPNPKHEEIKLPKISLPTFSGDYLAWRTFYDLFKSLVHDNEHLSPVQKLQYLKAHLAGEAHSLLSNTNISSANYEPAWETLVARYDNKRVLVKAQLDVLLNQPNVNQESAKGVKNLLDKTSESLAALKNLGINTDTWDPILVYLIGQRLPYETLELWEQSLSSNKDLPKWDDLKSFLESRFRTLEIINLKRKPLNKESRPVPAEKSWRKPQTFHVTMSSACCLCHESHSIRKCPKYLSFTPQARFEVIKSKGLCINCLGTGHVVVKCPSKLKCQVCHRSHHTTLHKTLPDGERKENNIQPESSSQSFTLTNNIGPSAETKSFVLSKSSRTHQILLATALVIVVSPTGQKQICRALIDPGSQASFVVENVAQNLSLSRKFINVNITGLGNTSTERIRARTEFTIEPKKSSCDAIHVQAFIVEKITNILPSNRILDTNWEHLKGLELADPTFDQPGRIDLLLGADVYPLIISSGVRKGAINTPVGQQTVFGWILSGETSIPHSQSIHLKNFHINVNPCDLLRKFWEMEEIPSTSLLTEDENRCEQHFGSHHLRHPNGRYQVRLPFISDQVTLGSSRNIAISRLIQMEKRFDRDPDLKADYKTCMEEYLKLGHMTPTSRTEKELMKYDENGNTYYECAYLPHHAVIKLSSTTTKVRVVFDASRKTSNGRSLNDILLKGPILQETLFSILMRWRKYKIAFMADVQKMYRQILMHPDDAEYQRIVWRDSPDQPFGDYKLMTVTFGTKSAPYLAIRTMQQLAKDESHNYPIGSEAILHDFYVDDLISGGNTVDEALLKQFQIIRILQAGGLDLRKWASNDETILKAVPEENREVHLPLSVNSEEVRALGMLWNPENDTLSYKIQREIINSSWTKRRILSEIAKLFDPIGWLAPVTITAKVLIQALWLVGLEWDAEIPERIEIQWKQYWEKLNQLENIQIPRWIRTGVVSSKIELHGFCDASIKAYAAVVYIRVEEIDGKIDVHILSAKTKVAPIKTISLPKLELCGATLLAKLLIQVQQDLQLNISKIYAWTDSTIVLAWLRKHPSNWETFIANRVSQVHQLLQGGVIWAHVSTESNPADCASRGIDPEKLKHHILWWNGPSWLGESKDNWPKMKDNIETSLGISKRALNVHLSTTTCNNWDLLCKFSKLSKLIKIVAYCQRWIRNVRKLPQHRQLKLYLTSEELQSALSCCLRVVQTEYFPEEYQALHKNRSIHKQSKLIKLNPFLHSDGLIRVGGRLRNSSLTFSERHPIILPEKHHITYLIIDNMHKATMHGGTQIMLSLLRRKYWILNARNAVRLYNHKCIICFRQTAQTRTQLMADLPDYRITRARPFAHTGVDYCGPFDIKNSKGRGVRCYKGYIAVFVCMVTKALHLELVSNLSTQGFLAAFRRFTSRRGLCTDVYSDCGSNFIGASAILTRYKCESLTPLEHEIAQAIESDGIKWHFIPPSSPHFGGLWESGVKSVKTHLKKILGNAILTYEEFNTLLNQIEATLNSRPLTEISQDPDDLSALTPGHFLVGGPLLAPPEPTLLDVNINRLDRYQYIQKLFQTFWTRWSSEYLHRLQQRPKWLSKQPNLKENDLVLVKDERLPPSRWLMGRIVKTHPGRDNLTRVVTLRTQNNIIKRPITKISPLPIDMPSQPH